MQLTTPRPTPLRSLLHRGLVEHNPLYLFSAALVLSGLTLISQDLAQESALVERLGISGMAEAYCFALIGGAAFLVRVGRRRPAVMLGLIAVVFQGDLTMHVETCAYLGVAGKIATAAWVLLFILKLYGLAWALELRLSRSAVLIPIAGAIGLAVFPILLHDVELSARGGLVALWLFGLGASAVWSSRGVTSAVAMDERGRKCVSAAWMLWAALAVCHSIQWSVSKEFGVSAVLYALPLLATRWARREGVVWGWVGGTLVTAAIFTPDVLWVVAAMATVVLVTTAANARFTRVELPVVVLPELPYRTVDAPVASLPPVVYAFDPRAAARLLVGGAAAAYLAAWTPGWEGGPFPDHQLWLDALLVVACVVIARRTRSPLLTVPLAPMLAHFAAQRGWVPAPHSLFGWGVVTTGAGFAALATAVLTSWRLGRHLPERAGSDAPTSEPPSTAQSP